LSTWYSTSKASTPRDRTALLCADVDVDVDVSNGDDTTWVRMNFSS
jgi:hypothetical protein